MRSGIQQDSVTDLTAHGVCVRGADETREERGKMQCLVIGMKNIKGKIDIFKHTSDKMGGSRKAQRIQRDLSLGRP